MPGISFSFKGSQTWGGKKKDQIFLLLKEGRILTCQEVNTVVVFKLKKQNKTSL